MESFKESMYWQIWADGCSLHKRFYGIREDDTPAWEQLFQAVEAFGKKLPTKLSRKRKEAKRMPRRNRRYTPPPTSKHALDQWMRFCEEMIAENGRKPPHRTIFDTKKGGSNSE